MSGSNTLVETKPQSPVTAQAIAILDQCAELVARLPDATYRADSRVLAGGTVGKHLRHTLDHFRAAIEGGLGGSAIDYDHRSRNVPEETDRAAALGIIEALTGSLRRADAPMLARPVSIRVMLSADGHEVTLGSTLARELAFASHHAVHHQAMMKAIAAEHGVDCPCEFGKAPSTLNFERSRS